MCVSLSSLLRHRLRSAAPLTFNPFPHSVEVEKGRKTNHRGEWIFCAQDSDPVVSGPLISRIPLRVSTLTECRVGRTAGRLVRLPATRRRVQAMMVDSQFTLLRDLGVGCHQEVTTEPLQQAGNPSHHLCHYRRRSVRVARKPCYNGRRSMVHSIRL